MTIPKEVKDAIDHDDLVAMSRPNVYVVMGNDFPHSVWTTKELAEAAIERNKTETTEAYRQDIGPRIYWRVYEFALNNKRV